MWPGPAPPPFPPPRGVADRPLFTRGAPCLVPRAAVRSGRGAPRRAPRSAVRANQDSGGGAAAPVNPGLAPASLQRRSGGRRNGPSQQPWRNGTRRKVQRADRDQQKVALSLGGFERRVLPRGRSAGRHGALHWKCCWGKARLRCTLAVYASARSAARKTPPRGRRTCVDLIPRPRASLGVDRAATRERALGFLAWHDDGLPYAFRAHWKGGGEGVWWTLRLQRDVAETLSRKKKGPLLSYW